MDYIGGLVGKLEAKLAGTASIDNSYAAGDVNGTNNIGGLVGLLENGSVNSIEISNSYAVGNLTGSNKGGLVGVLSGSGEINVKNSFWDTSTTGVINDIGLLENTGSMDIFVNGTTTAEMQDIATFLSNYPAWDIVLDESYTGSYLYPRLTMSAGLPVWKIKLQNVTIEYNLSGLVNNYDYNGDSSYWLNAWDAESIFGSEYGHLVLGVDYIFNFDGSEVFEFTNAGYYNYIDINFLKAGFYGSGVPGNLTINPRPVTVTVDSLTKSVGYIDPLFSYKITEGSLVSGDSLGVPIGSNDYIPSSSGTADKLVSQGGSISITDRDSIKHYSNLDLARIEGEAVGDYVISASGVTNSNYSVTVNDGNLKIKARPVIVNTASKASYSMNGLNYLNMSVEQGGINLGGK